MFIFLSLEVRGVELKSKCKLSLNMTISFKLIAKLMLQRSKIKVSKFRFLRLNCNK